MKNSTLVIKILTFTSVRKIFSLKQLKYIDENQSHLIKKQCKIEKYAVDFDLRSGEGMRTRIHIIENVYPAMQNSDSVQ